MAKVYYINGFLTAQARKVCELYFGAFFVELRLIQEKREFHIYLKRSIEVDGEVVQLTDFVDVADFKEWSGAQWKIFYDTPAEQA